MVINLITKRTYLTKPLKYTIAMRFGHGDRPMGHALKILQGLAKKTPPLNASSVANTPQETSNNKPNIKEVPPEIPTLPESPSYKDTLAYLGAKMFHSIPTPHQTSGPLGFTTQVSKTTLTVPNNQPVPHTHVRRYAVRTVNEPEVITANTDPQAIHNNPPIVKGKKVFRHKEAHRQECQSNPDCKKQDCPVLCGPSGDRDAVAHFTTNKNPTLESGKQNHAGSNTNLDNKPGYQGIVTYDKAHTTGGTSEHIPGTQKLNNEPSLKQLILTYEDKK